MNKRASGRWRARSQRPTLKQGRLLQRLAISGGVLFLEHHPNGDRYQDGRGHTVPVLEAQGVTRFLIPDRQTSMFNTQPQSWRVRLPGDGR